MAGKTYMTKGYSPYTYIPARQGDLDNGPNAPVSPYDFETKTTKQPPATTLGYKFSGSRTKFELLKEYVYAPNMSTGSKYAPMNPYQGYEPNYGLKYENSSPYMKPNYASSPNEHLFSRPVYGYPSEESHGVHSGYGLARASPSPVRTQNIPSHVMTQNIPTPDKLGQSGGPPTRPNPLTTLPNNISDDTLARPTPDKLGQSGGPLTRPNPLTTLPNNIGDDTLARPSPDKLGQSGGPPTRPNPLTAFNDISDDTAARSLYTRLPLVPKPNIGHNFTNT